MLYGGDTSNTGGWTTWIPCLVQPSSSEVPVFTGHLVFSSKELSSLDQRRGTRGVRGLTQVAVRFGIWANGNDLERWKL